MVEEKLVEDDFSRFGGDATTSEYRPVMMAVPANFRDQVCRYFNKYPYQRFLVYNSSEAFNVSQCVYASKQFSLSEHPVYVMPSGRDAVKGFEIGGYCQFKFRVNSLEINRRRFELCGAYYALKENGEKDWLFAWSGEPVDTRAWRHALAQSLFVNVYWYLATTEDGKEFCLMSDKRLRPGSDYEARALVWDVKKNELKMRINEHQIIAYAVDLWEEAPRLPDQKILEKCKDKKYEWFVKSVMYPFDNCVYLYGRLVTSQVFHLKTFFPMNMWVVGIPGTGKSAVLDKLAVITGDRCWDSGRSTVRGILPSFANGNKQASGALVAARRRALINEFSDIIATAQPYERASIMDAMKGILEGKETNYTSGVGSTTVRMSGDCIAMSNPPRKTGGSMYDSILEMYASYLSDALLDRFVFIWLGASQYACVAENKPFVQQTLVATGQKDLDKALAFLDYGDLLSPLEIRSLMDWANTLTYNIEDMASHVKWLRAVETQKPAMVVSRPAELFENLCTSMAFIRSLGAGMQPNDKSITITAEDERLAADLMLRVIGEYSQLQLETATRFKIKSQLSNEQSKVYDYIEQKSKGNGDDKFKRLTPIKELLDLVGGEESLKAILDRLAALHLIVFDSAYALCYDESTEGRRVFDEIMEGHCKWQSEMLPLHLVKRGLAIKNSAGEFVSVWSNKFDSRLPTAFNLSVFTDLENKVGVCQKN